MTPAPLQASTLTRREMLRLLGLGTALGVAAACAPATPAAPKPTEPAKPAAQATSAPATAAPAAKPTVAAAQQPTTAPAAATAGQPRRGGTLTWGQWDSNESIDPGTASGASGTEIVGNILDTLVVMDADERVYPSLASRWTVADDARTYTFTLRDGVKFHDGSMLTADAVKRSWGRILDPANKDATAALLGPIDGIDAPDPKTVVVTFKEPFPLLLLQIWRPSFAILSPTYLDTVKSGDKAEKLVGSGPFKLGGKSADGVYTLEANSDYAWGPETLKNRAAPYLQSIRFRSIPDAGTRLATLESGESLLIDEVPEPDYNRMKADRRFTFVETPRRGLAVGFFLNMQKAPTSDKAVREAINWALDRKAMVERLFFGIHRVAVGPLSEGVWGRLDELERRFSFDPARARQVLEDAGWKAGSDGIRMKDGERLSVTAATYLSPWHELAAVVQSQLRDVGIEVKADKMARGPYLDAVRAGQINLAQSAGTNFDPDELRVRYHSANKSANFAFLEDKELDALLTKGSQQALGSAERRQTYEAAQRRLMDVLPFVSVMTQVRVQGMAARVHDLRMGPHGLNALPMTDTWLDG